ncbi:hypothetical protein PsorP6_007183 [Peronosclerospora sorghi]|uniref:Uncharacterized protein n=1 Tax=Peronosclerospora sorghi TaxID=230839 RepID=A0ACC0W9Z4_9STRA|nr:hypothetical protein PsorP6_007183 [Peronosclerospora sorghi]
MDLWWQNTSDAMHLTLKMMLTSLQAQQNLPILFLACTSSTPGYHERVPADLRTLFEDDPSVARSSLVLDSPRPAQMRDERILNKSLRPFPIEAAHNPRAKS